MKFSKKTMAMVLAGTMALSSAPCVLADAGTAAPEAVTATEKSDLLYSKINVGDWIADQENWVAGEGTMTFSDQKIAFKKAPTAKQMMAYKGQKADNAVFQFKMAIDLENGNWGGFGVRSVATDSLAWGGNSSYLVVIKDSQFELQRFNSAGNKFLAIVENDGIVKSNEEVNITFGSVNVDGGVQLFMYVNGKPIFNCFDADGNQITKDGYLAFYSGTTMSVAAYDGKDEIGAIPVGFHLEGGAEEGALNASYQTLALTEGQTADNYAITWGRNDKYTGTITELETTGTQDFGKKFVPVGQYPAVSGVNGDTYVISKDDEESYVTAYLTDGEGNLLCTAEPYFYDVISSQMKQMIILYVDCEYAYLFGEKVSIDPADPWVVPTVVNDRTLVPLRFISESLGAEVGWDEETQTVTIQKEDQTIKMTLEQQEYSVNGETKTMDVAPTTMRDRTMVPLRVISETFGKNVFWDDKGLIIISDEAPIWDSEADADVIDRIIEDIQELL